MWHIRARVLWNYVKNNFRVSMFTFILIKIKVNNCHNIKIEKINFLLMVLILLYSVRAHLHVFLFIFSASLNCDHLKSTNSGNVPSLSKCKVRSLKSERATSTTTIRNKKERKKIAYSFLSSINLPFRIEQSEFNLDLIRGKTDLPAPRCRR